MSPWWLLVAAPAVLDSVYRLVLLLASRHWRPASAPAPTDPGERCLVLVPSRAEGAAIEPTLRSVSRAANGCPVKAVVLLDGADPEAAEIAHRWQADVLVKDPPGPSKAATLAWAAEHVNGDLSNATSVLVLDVGSELDEHFFHSFAIPRDADGMQAFLQGVGTGPGQAAALSEGVAQRCEDCGREALGWSVRLRGTGFALRPDTFRAVAPELRTLVDDLEMSVLLAARGKRLVMGPQGAVVLDHKPQHCGSAARQRARWLVGQVTLPFRHPYALLRLLLKRPLEALGFVGDVAARPLSLTVPLRLGLAALLVAWPPWSLSATAVVAATSLLVITAVSDVIVHLGRGRGQLRGALSLGAAWAGAVVLLPRALTGWLWARRR